MKIEIVDAQTPGPIQARDMEIGQVGEVLTNATGYSGALLLRHYDGLVNLRSPNQMWAKTATLPVRLLPPGTVLTLTLES